MGTTFAVVQSVGIVPCFSEAWKNSVNVGVSLWVCGLVRLLCVRSLSVHSSL